MTRVAEANIYFAVLRIATGVLLPGNRDEVRIADSVQVSGFLCLFQ
jgi:hypothetical protein